MSDLYVQVLPCSAKIGDYVEYRYTKRVLGFVSSRRYSKILEQDLITCTKYPYEIDINDVIVFRYIRSE